MTAATNSTSLVQPVFTDAEWLALAGFLTGYRGQSYHSQRPRIASVLHSPGGG
jgi:hypothetical protein